MLLILMTLRQKVLMYMAYINMREWWNNVKQERQHGRDGFSGKGQLVSSRSE